MSTGLALVAALGVLALVATLALERYGGVRELALIAALAAAAAAGRVLLAPLPSVQPVTVICLVTGAALGLRAGVAVGALAALLSNGFLGHGPWTPAQMVLWALAGATGALLGDRMLRRSVLVPVAALWGFAFSWGMNLWFLATFGPEVSEEAMLAVSARSLPFDIAHATGNAIIALVVGPALARLIVRYRRRIRVRSIEEPSAAIRRGSGGDPGTPPGRAAW